MDTLILNKDGSPLSMLPLSLVSWKVAMRLIALEKVKVLKHHDDWTINTPSTAVPVPSVVITNVYVKWNRQVKYSRNNVFLRDDYECQYCGASKDLTIDHVLPRSYGGGTSWDNVTTSCHRCNSHKGNDKRIVPNNKPYKPTYYELVAKAQSKPLPIKDLFWLSFISWPEENVIYRPHTQKRSSNVRET